MYVGGGMGGLEACLLTSHFLGAVCAAYHCALMITLVSEPQRRAHGMQEGQLQKGREMHTV